MPHTLLLADDSVTIQRVIELTFADEDVRVVTAGDGEQAIASIQADPPDIVLADIGMPKRSGYDVAAFIKGRPDLAHIPVLLLTGAFEPVDEARAQAVRCDGVLVKPFEPQHVIARVHELLRRAAGSAGSIAPAVADIARPVERLAPQRPPADDFDFSVPPQPAPRPAPENLDDYFERLDAAFANMTAMPAEAHVPPRHEEPLPDDVPLAGPELGGFQAPAPTAATFASPPSAFDWPASPPASPQQPPLEPPDVSAQLAGTIPNPYRPDPSRSYAAPEPAPAPVEAGSAIASAFTALLAEEQGEPGAAPVRLQAAGAPPQITDALIEEITRRVVERLGTAAVRQVVADVVRETSERLIREEITRLRSKGKS